MGSGPYQIHTGLCLVLRRGGRSRGYGAGFVERGVTAEVGGQNALELSVFSFKAPSGQPVSHFL